VNRPSAHPGVGILVLAIMLSLASGARALAREAPDPLIARLQARLDRMAGLKGRFVQSLDSKSLGRPRTEEGRFCVKKPSRMRWDYEKPEQKLAILDGSQSWLYIPADREVYRGSRKSAQEGGAAALLLAGRVRLDADFVTRRLSPEEAGPQGVVGAVTIELKPKQPSEDYERLLVAIEPEQLAIRRITVVDSLGGRMTFDLFDLTEDPALSDDLFRFEVPAGVEIIENR
jgi:outer membrane lipoprotein carrier protein